MILTILEASVAAEHEHHVMADSVFADVLIPWWLVFSYVHFPVARGRHASAA